MARAYEYSRARLARRLRPSGSQHSVGSGATLTADPRHRSPSDPKLVRAIRQSSTKDELPNENFKDDDELLSYVPGTIIKVTEMVREKWWTGSIEHNTTSSGLFAVTDVEWVRTVADERHV
jgi:hypothetical protein